MCIFWIASSKPTLPEDKRVMGKRKSGAVGQIPLIEIKNRRMQHIHHRLLLQQNRLFVIDHSHHLEKDEFMWI